MYTVNTGVNDRIDTSAGVATIAAGVYTPTTLAAAVQTALVAIDATFTCTYSALTLKFTIGRPIAITLQFGTGANLARSLGPTMGFAAADVTGITNVANNAALLASPEAILVRSDALMASGPPSLSSNIGASAKYGNVIARIPLSGGAGSGYTQWAAILGNEDIHYPDTGVQINRIDMKFYDADSGNEIFLNGEDWSCEISFDVNEEKTRRR